MKQSLGVSFAFLAGAGALAAIMGLTSSAPPSVASSNASNPRELVRIIEGDSYVVPAGKVLTIKTLTSIMGGMGQAILRINGQAVLGARTEIGPQEFTLGVLAKAGETVVVEEAYPDPFQTVEALGYLSEF